MELMHLNPAPDSRFSWFNYERRNWIVALALAACVGYAGGNGHTTQGAILNVSQQLGDKKAELTTLKTKVIPKLKAQAGCEHSRADKASVVAEKAIVGAVVDSAPVPSPKEIPADNCPKAPVK